MAGRSLHDGPKKAPEHRVSLESNERKFLSLGGPDLKRVHRRHGPVGPFGASRVNTANILHDVDRTAAPTRRALWKRIVFPFAAVCIGVLLTLLLVEAAL